MYLKKLELFGFKSFADRTEFAFRSGMTAVVGPNGCGKSNVVDAFKWIFGEQSAKGLRGSEMKDVIFNGTQRRKPTGFAEVTVVFDNHDSFLDIDFAEVAITRRLFRSGDSEYLINKEKCRLKDIKELIMDTGLGRTSYSILEQGKIDVLLQANQQDRRLIFEEAAGISKYRAKKAEALRALGRVEENLTRLTDIIQEVEKRVQRLKAQAGRARRYRVLVEKLKELRIRTAVVDYKESVRARTDLAFDLYWAQFQIDRLEALGGELTDKLEARSRERQSLGSRLQTQRDKLSAERILLERTKERIEHDTQRLTDFESERRKKITSSEETMVAVEKVREHIREESAELEAVRREIESNRGLLDRRKSQREELRREGENLQLALRRRKDALVVLLERRSRVANGIVQLESELRGLALRGGRLRAAVSDAADQLSVENERKILEEDKLRAAQEDHRRLEETRRQLEAGAEELEGKRRDLETRLEETLSALHQKQSRYEVLETLEENLEGVGRGMRDLLRREDQLTALGNVHGLLANLIRVEREHARAVEAVLGQHAQAMVVETQDGALGLLDIARGEELGAVEVICLDRVDHLRFEEFPQHDGVIGALRDKVTVPEPFSGLINRLLANVLLVTDFSTAIVLSRNGLRPFRLVTLRGEVIEPWGALSLSGVTDFGLISRRSEMEELAAEVSRLGQDEADARERMNVVREAIAARRVRIDELTSELSICSRTSAQIEEKIAHTVREINRLEREFVVSRSELTELDEELATREREKADLERRLSEVDAEHERCDEAMQGQEAEIASVSEAARAADEALTQARLELAQAERREDALRELLRHQQSNLEEKEAARMALLDDVEHLSSRHEGTQHDLKAAERELVELTDRVASLRRLLEADEDTDRELRVLETRYHAEIDHVRKEVSRVHEKREAVQLRDQEQRHRRNTIMERLQEDYGIDLVDLLRWEEAALAGEAPAAEGSAPGQTGGERRVDSQEEEVQRSNSDLPGFRDAAPEMPAEARYLVPDPEWNRQESREEVKKLQERMRRMGSVNLEALEELEELEERYQFQESQRDDLVNSETNLRGIIDEINHTSRERFLATFDVVRNHFSQLFRKCFGGGKAELLLEEGVDVLDAGIEIIARPPGKKISSLSLMSGGEKTMTTIALLFSIFRARPCPFCVLDEVDAPLDEVNVGRFVVLLKEFLADTQFIIVTHNKASMAEADTLYGVTMQERGISTQVAVELETFDQEAMAREAAATPER